MVKSRRASKKPKSRRSRSRKAVSRKRNTHRRVLRTRKSRHVKRGGAQDIGDAKSEVKQYINSYTEKIKCICKKYITDTGSLESLNKRVNDINNKYYDKLSLIKITDQVSSVYKLKSDFYSDYTKIINDIPNIVRNTSCPDYAVKLQEYRGKMDKALSEDKKFIKDKKLIETLRSELKVLDSEIKTKSCKIDDITNNLNKTRMSTECGSIADDW